MCGFKFISRYGVGAVYVLIGKNFSVKDASGKQFTFVANKKKGVNLGAKKYGGWTAAFDLAKRIAGWI